MAMRVNSRLTRLLLTLSIILSSFTQAVASRGLGSDPQQINIYAIRSIEPRGLKLAQGSISYNDGDVLSGVFRIYCPTKMIRPTNYTLQDRKGSTKRKGKWWQDAFKPKWKVEHELVSYVCNTSDFGAIQ